MSETYFCKVPCGGLEMVDQSKCGGTSGCRLGADLYRGQGRPKKKTKK
jgi:hypothetical protein